MNLLVVTFALDELDGALAWQVKVVAELARHCDVVVAVTDRLGRASLPDNVVVSVIPRRPFRIPRRLGGRWAYNWHVRRICLKHEIDAVFLHMAVAWAPILRPTFRRLGLPVVGWYAHGTVTRMLRRAIRSADVMLTSSPEGCRVDSSKVRAIGQGVDTDLFSVPAARALQDIVYVGRVSRRKHIDLLIQVAEAMRKRQMIPSPRLRIVGPTLTLDDLDYDREARSMVWELGLEGLVDMAGFIPHDRIPALYETAFLHLNLSRTGSMDKTVLEALSAGCPVLTSNEAFFDVLVRFPEFIVRDERPAAVAEQIEHIHDRRARYDPFVLRALVEGHHDQRSYARRIIEVIEPLVRV